MIDTLIAFCTSDAGLKWLIFAGDALIALAYFSIPVAMLWVFRHRKVDLPYPALWIAFVLFIFACGLTHVLHAVGALWNAPLLGVRTAVHLFTAVVSVITAVALTLVLPKIALLPSPRQQRAQLEAAVASATQQKDQLLLELHHRVGNQLAKLGAVVRREMRDSNNDKSLSLHRLQDLLEELGDEHHRLSSFDYAPTSVPPLPAESQQPFPAASTGHRAR
jgi:hypothetical protein